MLRVEAEGYGLLEVAVDIPSDMSEPDEVRVELVPLRTDAKPTNQQCDSDFSIAIAGPACVVLWESVPAPNAPNMRVRRGCPSSNVRAVAWRFSDGDNVRIPGSRHGSWFTLHLPGGRPVWYRLDPSADDAACPVETSSVTGYVAEWDPAWHGSVWVVAISRDPVVAETRVASDGTFAFAELPVGCYGLRVGDDSCRDLWAAQDMLHLEDFEREADPWPGALLIDVTPNRALHDIELHRSSAGVG